jgi:hypothetical protein
MTTFGNNAKGPDEWGAGVNYNEGGSPFTVPATGTITRLGLWLAPNTASSPTEYLPTRLCIWNASGVLLGKTATFNVTVPDHYVAANYAADLTAGVAVTAGQTVYLGYWCQVLSDGCLLNPRCQDSGTFYLKKAGNSAPGNLTLSGSVPNTIQAYAYLTPATAIVKIRRGGVWVNADVKVRRSGAWVTPTEVRVRRAGGWHDV